MSRHAPLLIFAAAIGVLAAHTWLFTGVIVDDAYISFRYARHLVDGLGLAYNVGEPVEGYTNFSWVLLAAAAMRTGLDPRAAMPALGFLCAIALLGVVAESGRRLAQQEGQPSRLAGLPASAIVAATTGAAFYAVTGLETLLYTLLLTIAVVALLARRGVAFAVATSLAFFTRPEAALLGAVGSAYLFVRELRQGRNALTVFGVLVLPYLAWKWLYFGALLPNTFYAKPSSWPAGVDSLLRALGLLGDRAMQRQALGGLVLAAALGLRGRESAPRRALFAVWLLYALAVVFEGDDWMVAHRLFLPVLPCLALAVDGLLVQSLTRFRARPFVHTVVLLGAATYGLGQAAQTRAVVTFFQKSRHESVCLAQLGEALQHAGVRSAALFDIGVFGYTAGALEILDLGGLTDPVVARSPGGMHAKRFPEAYFLRRAPDIVILTSHEPPRIDETGALPVRARMPVERHLASLETFRSEYRYADSAQCGPDFHLHLLSRLGPLRLPEALRTKSSVAGPAEPPR